MLNQEMGKETIGENVKREKQLLSCIQDLWNGINALPGVIIVFLMIVVCESVCLRIRKPSTFL